MQQPSEPKAPGPLSGAWDRIYRAQEHLEAIKCELLSYYNADGCTLSGKYNPDAEGGTGAIEGGFVSTPPIGPRLNTLIGEMLHDTRSALDHLAWQLVLDTGKEPIPEKTNFPIWTCAPKTDRDGKDALPNIKGGISLDARTLISAVQPYKWGARYREHPLWLLHQLWNIDKHRYVIAKGSRTAVKLPHHAPTFTFTTALESATEHGARLRIVPDDPSVGVDMHTTIEIAIHETGYGIEQPLLRTLEKAQEVAHATVELAEGVCFKSVISS